VGIGQPLKATHLYSSFLENLIDLFKEGFVDGHTIFCSVEGGEVFFFADGIDSFGAGHPFTVSQFTEDITGSFAERIGFYKVFNIDGVKEMSQSSGCFFSIFDTGEC
jgi:hypothetical protein